jgi:hypothetical protein
MGLFSFFKRQIASQPTVKPAPRRKLNNAAVKPDNTPLRVRRGWSTRGSIYQGYYRTKYGAWRGEIRRRGDKFNVYIFKPPKEQLQKLPRWHCFHQEGSDKWRINLAVNPKDGDVSAIIFYVERLVIESFER